MSIYQTCIIIRYTQSAAHGGMRRNNCKFIKCIHHAAVAITLQCILSQLFCGCDILVNQFRGKPFIGISTQCGVFRWINVQYCVIKVIPWPIPESLTP